MAAFFDISTTSFDSVHHEAKALHGEPFGGVYLERSRRAQDKLSRTMNW